MLRKGLSWTLSLLLLAFIACAARWAGQNLAETKGSSAGVTAQSQSQPPASNAPVQSAATGQSQPPSGGPPPPLPIPPAIISYDYAQSYLLQWIYDNLDYSVIEAVITSGSTAVYEVITTDKATSRRVYYTNSELKAKALATSGKTVHVVPIAYKLTESLGEHSTQSIVFQDEKGQTIRWNFVAASDQSERGKGLSAAAPPLEFLYRPLGTAAGDGSAVQVGAKVSQAKPWPEISAPPYFVAYHGVYTTESVLGGFASGSETWRLKYATPNVDVGSMWVLLNEQNNARQFKVTAKRGDELTIEEIGVKAEVSSPMTMTARMTAGGFAISSIGFANGKNSLRVSFKPELIVGTSATSDPVKVDFQVDVADQKKAFEGTISAQRTGEQLELDWHLNSPNWAKGKVVKSTITFIKNGYRIEER
jgi:hypothetical protein